MSEIHIRYWDQDAQKFNPENKEKRYETVRKQKYFMRHKYFDNSAQKYPMILDDLG